MKDDLPGEICTATGLITDCLELNDVDEQVGIIAMCRIIAGSAYARRNKVLLKRCYDIMEETYEILEKELPPKT